MKKQSANAGSLSAQNASSSGGAFFSLSDGTEIAPERYESARKLASELSETSFRLVLGSRSPRRRQLLSSSNYRFAILPSEDGVEEEAETNELQNAEPIRFVSRLAFLKARNVVERLKSADPKEREEVAKEFGADRTPFVVVSCDSVAVCKGEIMGKPNDRADAERMLRKLSGSLHAVHTGLCVWRVDPSGVVAEKTIQRVETSVLQMEPLSEERLNSYLESGLWQGKAGAFGYQDGNDWLELRSGSGSNVVGLPLEALAVVLASILD